MNMIIIMEEWGDAAGSFERPRALTHELFIVQFLWIDLSCYLFLMSKTYDNCCIVPRCAHEAGTTR